MSVIATSVFWTRSSSAFSMSSFACSCLAGPAVFNLAKKIYISVNGVGIYTTFLRLFGRVEFESAGTNGLTGLHGDVDRGRQRRLPREEVLPLDRIVLLDARASDGLPNASIQTEGPPELIFVAPWRIVQHRGSTGGSTTERMGQRLVLRRHGGDGVRRREVRALEIGGCKIRDPATDVGGQLGNRLLNLGGVVVRLGLVCLGDPVCGPGQICTTRARCCNLT